MLIKIFRATAIHQISSGYHVWNIHCAVASGNTDGKAYACNFLRLTDEVHSMSYITKERERKREGGKKGRREGGGERERKIL